MFRVSYKDQLFKICCQDHHRRRSRRRCHLHHHHHHHQYVFISTNAWCFPSHTNRRFLPWTIASRRLIITVLYCTQLPFTVRISI
jgi:hypothetical protein